MNNEEEFRKLYLGTWEPDNSFESCLKRVQHGRGADIAKELVYLWDKSKELEAKDAKIADLKERISQVNDWLNSDTIFMDYEAIEGFRLLTKESQ